MTRALKAKIYDPVDLMRAPSGTIAFTGAANLGQAATAVTVYTITGRVMILHMPPPFVTEALVSTVNLGTISLGVASDVIAFIGATTVGAGTFAVNDWWWRDTSIVPGVGRDPMDFTSATKMVISENLIIDCLTQNITDGTLRFDGLMYRPLTAGARLALGPNMVAV